MLLCAPNIKHHRHSKSDKIYLPLKTHSPNYNNLVTAVAASC